MGNPALATHFWGENIVDRWFSQRHQCCGAFLFVLLWAWIICWKTFDLWFALQRKRHWLSWMSIVPFKNGKLFMIILSSAICLLRTKLRKVPGHQHFWCRQCKIYTELILKIVTPLGVMNLVYNGPSNGWLSDAAKPLPDAMLTSHQYAPLCLISMQVMSYIDDGDNFESILFKMSPGLNELTNLSGKALYILLTLTWDDFMEFPLTGLQLINHGLEFFVQK